ncbi:hypothetical protein EV582_4734 [Duganella sp. BK701]|nr:hypothetical protein EV582_4734 [Duganella sp. BK701]
MRSEYLASINVYSAVFASMVNLEHAVGVIANNKWRWGHISGHS